MSFQAKLKQIRKKQFPEVILLYGNEPYFIQTYKKTLMETIVGDDLENISTYDLEETPIEEVITDVETYPFFGGNKLVIATNPVFLTTERMKLPFTHELDALETYINHPVDYSILVFILENRTIDKRRKITKQLLKKALVFDCHAIKDAEKSDWIEKIAQQFDLTIDPDARELLDSKLPNQLQMIENELLKISTYVGDNRRITKDIVDEIVPHTEMSTALQLVDAVIAQNLDQAISIFRELEKLNEEPIAMIALLAYQFRIILQVKLLKEKGYSQYQMERILKVHSYVVKIAYQRERYFTKSELKKIIHQLTETDLSIKEGKMDSNLAFEMLLYTLVHSETR